MAKRFTDSNKYRKGFMRGLKGPYKLLWDFLYHECDHAGIWHVDFEIAQILVGRDMPVSESDALTLFNDGEERVRVVDSGKRWVIVPFIEFQYGLPLDPDNRVHASVLKALAPYRIKALTSPLQGAKDKDKETEKGIQKSSGEGGAGETPTTFEQFWSVYPRKRSRGQAERAWKSLNPSTEQGQQILSAVARAKTSTDWLKAGGQYIPYAATWLRSKGWLDEVDVPAPGVEDLIYGWKMLVGVSPDDTVWDRERKPDQLPAAQSLLNMFGADVDAALDAMESVYNRLTGRKLTVSSLQAIVNNAGVERQKWQEKREKQGVA